MAKYTPGPMSASTSGSIGGTTFSRNRGGQYIRRRAIPTNPDSIPQQTVRAILSEQSQAWADRTDAERDAWKNWAIQNPITDVLGQQITLTGHQAFIKLNSRLDLTNDTELTAPPIINAPAGLLTLALTADIGVGTTEITFTTTPTAAGVKLWLTAALVNSAGISYVRNLRRFIVATTAALASPFDYQADLELVLGTMIVGQTVHVSVRTFDTATGLISLPLTAAQVVITT